MNERHPIGVKASVCPQSGWTENRGLDELYSDNRATRLGRPISSRVA